MMRDITPKQFKKCPMADCPAVFALEDGRYAVKGKLIGMDGNEATVIFAPEMIIAALVGEGMGDEKGSMNKTAFEKIEEGLKEALEIARGNSKPANFSKKGGNL